ncbi:hypothetical protein [Vibrio sp. LaRot3]|uniref:hypothetical protein n=1 Tax=Vibrio sp. LaRot3 TaxID=2998829 RepID=UPI0022CDBC96|nr:hypothetical protein [Vibrio sp. LaRot3]MDA0150136.1 hypothetical protein [Vibrio sp. LaRot3]
MYKFISSVLALLVGFISVLFGLLLAIPLTILALITGKKLRDTAKKQQANQPHHGAVLEGEYEDVSK